MRPAILVHGGAGPRSEADGDDEQSRAGALAAARAGHQVLRSGGSALDAVETACRALEDDPVFNAGHGAVLNEDGVAELDASIMDGATLKAGAVAVVTTLANPITAARRVMELTRHVLLVGAGAEAFAHEAGLPRIDNAALITPRARARFEAERLATHGTVGVVAVDQHGHVAAGTSTGGTSSKKRGRVGDSPLIGCGTYADDRWGAVSCTGVGEYIIRVTLARRVLDFLERGVSAQAAAEAGLAEVVRLGGDAGLIVVTPTGELAWATSSERMSRAWVDGAGAEGSGFLR
jgi:beta-aspartyl-peptidase (threonine type)